MAKGNSWPLQQPRTHYQDEQQTDAIIKRVKRAQGQMGEMVRMLEEGRSCEEIVTLMSAVAKAVNTAAFTLISASLKECIADPLLTPSK